MQNTLKLLLLIYSTTLILNLAVGIVLYKLTAHKLFKTLIYIWGFTLINFALQGVFITPGFGMYFSFSSYILVSLTIYQLSNFILNKQENLLKPGMMSLGLILIGAIAFHFTHNYMLSSIFSAIAISIPMFISSYRLWKLKRDLLDKVISLLIFLNAIHFLDYPFLRASYVGAIIGFSIALFLLFSFGSFLPNFILREVEQNYSKNLKIEVAERTTELAISLDQNKMLVNILCHDLSTPLTILEHHVKKMKNEPEPSLRDKYGEKAIGSLKTTINILTKVRELQAVSSGKTILKLNQINVSEIINEILSNFENLLAPKNLKLNFVNKMNTSVEIIGDSDLLKNEILTNLITNAIKFSYNDSSINIILSGDQEYINITVQDHGIGIPVDLLPKLFFWNEKTNRAGTSGESGTGFGLPLVKTCAEMIGAKIRVESTSRGTLDSNSGSKFIVQFAKVA